MPSGERSDTGNSEGEVERRLRLSEERFRAFVTATSDVVYSMSPDWAEMRFLVGKHFIADTTGPSRAWLERYILPEDHERVLAVIGEAIRTKSVFEMEHRVIRADGTLGWTFSRAVPIMSSTGEITEWFGAARDVTERKQREEALLEADQRKDEFIAVLAHELRNPLAPIANAVELLRMSRTDEPLQLKARAIIERQLAALKRLVDDLLESARITSGRLHLAADLVELGTIVERAVETVRPCVETRGHTLNVTLAQSIVLYADAARLQQVLVNLLNNAAKYTDRGGRIDVDVRLEHGHVVLSVKDTGIGIEPELLPRLFRPFTQAKHSLARSDGGLGLGLSIAHRLVKMHAGTIEVRSRVGYGSEFIVTLPLKISRSGADQVTSAEV